jgi:hypothetical protein
VLREFLRKPVEKFFIGVKSHVVHRDEMFLRSDADQTERKFRVDVVTGGIARMRNAKHRHAVSKPRGESFRKIFLNGIPEIGHRFFAVGRELAEIFFDGFRVVMHKNEIVRKYKVMRTFNLSAASVLRIRKAMIPKAISSVLIIALGIFMQCSFSSPANEDPVVNDTIPQELSIVVKFEKLIQTSHDASNYTLSLKKQGDYLVLHDSHVDSRNLSCVRYSTGEELWKIADNVDRFFFFGNAVVVQFMDHVELREIVTGKITWKAESTRIDFAYGEERQLPSEVEAICNGKNCVLDMKSGQTKTRLEKMIPAILHRITDPTRPDRSSTMIEDHFGTGDDLREAVIVQNRESYQKTFIWTLDEKKRTFRVDAYSMQHEKLKDFTWTMPVSFYNDTFRQGFCGLPEPSKLSTSAYVIGDYLFFYEDYSRYRWSWGRGTNRVTCFDWTKNEMIYQVWGQSPEDLLARKPFSGFYFFINCMLRSDGMMHFQMEPNGFSEFDFEKNASGDTLKKRFNLLYDYKDPYLAGFVYLQDSLNMRVNVNFSNYKTGSLSETSILEFGKQYPVEPEIIPDDDLIIFNYYDNKTAKSVLYCCRVEKR